MHPKSFVMTKVMKQSKHIMRNSFSPTSRFSSLSFLIRSRSALTTLPRSRAPALPRSRPAARRSRRAARSQMVCTLGPASCEPEKVQALVDIGMRIGRINMSHVPRGDYSFPLDILKRLRASVGVHSALAEEKSGAKHENVRAALLDTKGPEVRTGFVAGGGAYLTLEDAAEIELSADPAHRDACTPEVGVRCEVCAAPAKASRAAFRARQAARDRSDCPSVVVS